MSADGSHTHNPCCSSHGVDMTCDDYRRTHFVQVRPCCQDDQSILTGSLTASEWREFQSIPDQGYSHRHWVDAKIAQRVNATLRAVMALVVEHEDRERHNDTVPLNRLSDIRPEPSAAEYRAAIQQALDTAASTNRG
ncbi:hypothetical protein SEA_PULCHRA_91 [Microbacterium phage Pulchra]|uniref:Uncharacterized protein n=1 Tax=Microbacterium phage Pulchra TaxID=2816469 RepID=A0A8A5LNT8_9CAUD|nr:hypothetical protein SEA_PULCHRA_91 [Microbacterium phage Pulchra]